MFRKVLIANRGEIAVRVIRACRELGIPSVAVYSEADRDALHVRLADSAYPCGPAPARDSYLQIDRLIEIAERAGADAIHPGYGFLAENAQFARRCAAARIVFIGPSADVIAAMGDKLAARAQMTAAKIAVVPGTEASVTDGEIASWADRIGYPIVVKASAGGGGRGMRVVAGPAELAKAADRVRGEARSWFGDDTLYVEKYLEAPRHIEVQFLADAHGSVVHLGERECSIQRRHQKLIEEAPANGVTPEMRDAMGEASLRAARSVDYCGAGTCEFLIGSDSDDFYFLEMNTRIQVEHTITEQITGIDLVVEMMRCAAGEPLRVEQSEVGFSGHAIEARIYAEDPDRGFLPSPGRIEVYRPPSGPRVRVDSGVEEGSTVTPHYDPMIAKLIAWGADRPAAISELDRALAEFEIGGIATSIPFHRRALQHPSFVAGRYSTDFVAQLGRGPFDTARTRR